MIFLVSNQIQIEKFQDEYHEKFAECHTQGNSNASIEFMLDLKSKEAIRRHYYIHPALKLNLIQMTLPDKPQSRNQRYIKK